MGLNVMITQDDFNPHSHDSTFATILARLDQQDENLKLVPEILARTTKTNGRVTVLESKARCLAWIAGILLTVVGIFCTVFQKDIDQHVFLTDSITSIVSQEFNVTRKP